MGVGFVGGDVLSMNRFCVSMKVGDMSLERDKKLTWWKACCVFITT